MRRTRPAVLALVLLAGLLGGCRDDPTRTSAATPPSATATAASPAAPPSATPTSAAPPAGPVRRPARDGDVDGDGREDRVDVTPEQLTVVLTGGGRTSAPLSADTEPAVQGVVDVDGDGRAEVFVETTRGASTAFYTPFRYDGRTLGPLTLDGEPVLLGVGGTVTHGEGFACRKGSLVVATSTSDDGERYDATHAVYGVQGFALVGRREVRTGLPRDDAWVALSYALDCGSVNRDG